MSLAKDMLLEEKERLNEIISHYKSILKKYPKGAIVKKNIKNNQYAYLNYRKEGRHCSDYIGQFESDGVKKLIDQINERRKYESLLKESQANLKEVMRFLREK